MKVLNIICFITFRNNILNELSVYGMRDWPVTWEILLFGSDQLSVETNIQILSCVQRMYITN